MDLNGLSIRHHNLSSAPPPTTAYNSSGGGVPPHSRPKLALWHMSFYWGTKAEVLFSGWPGSSSGMYALAIVLVFFLAMAVEWLSNFNVVKPGANRAGTAFFQMGIHSIRAGFSYMVMLAVMSYNGGVFIAAVVGHAVGYVIFGSPIFKKGSARS